jgi:hypothetical protein
MATLLPQICRYFVFWIANGIRLSIEHGYHTAWNWGAAIGMSKVEFIHRVTLTFYYGGYSDLAIYMQNQAEQSNVDFGMRQYSFCHILTQKILIQLYTPRGGWVNDLPHRSMASC